MIRLQGDCVHFILPPTNDFDCASVPIASIIMMFAVKRFVNLEAGNASTYLQSDGHVLTRTTEDADVAADLKVQRT